jgi:putative endonuclease
MSLQKENGSWGEDLAANYLAQNGIEILHRNWRYKRAEVDIIGNDDGILVFIEVKTKSGTFMGRPEEVVGLKKKRMLFAAASAYMHTTGFEGEIRFDIIGIIGQPGCVDEMLHFKDAFYPGMDHL